MTFARFLYVDLGGKIAVACGSDSFLPIDGRLSLYNAKAKAEGQMFKLALVARFVGYEIHTGNIRHSRVVDRTILSTDKMRRIYGETRLATFRPVVNS